MLTMTNVCNKNLQADLHVSIKNVYSQSRYSGRTLGKVLIMTSSANGIASYS
jgi:hypothetical protein